MCWWPHLSCCDAGGSRRGLPQTGKGHFIILIIQIFLTDAALHRGKMFPFYCGVGVNEGCTNLGFGSSDPTQLTCTTPGAEFHSWVRPTDVSSGMAEPLQASWETTLASEHPQTPCNNSPVQIQTQVLSLMLKSL